MDQIKEDFQFLKNDERVLGVLLFGSRAENKAHAKSDFDVCIIAPRQKPEEILMKVFDKLDVEGKNYDVHLFEELPLHLKISVIKNHEIMFCKDEYEMSEYFYFYRKLWKDQEKRNTMSKEEVVETLS